MSGLSTIYDLTGRAMPLDCMHYGFMRHAMLGLLILAPMVSAMGVQVVNFRMAFFAEAIGHSTFAGVALGLLLSVSPSYSMPLLGLAVGAVIIALQKGSKLSVDTTIGVTMSAIVAFGIAMVSRDRHLAKDMHSFLFGDILTIDDTEILMMMGLFAILASFQFWGYNRMTLMVVNPILAKTHGVKVKVYQYAYAAMLSIIVIFSVRAVGVFLVTAMLVVPAATARNLARSAGGMFWWALAAGLSSAVIGLLISAQRWSQMATGATVVLCACVWFIASLAIRRQRRST